MKYRKLPIFTVVFIGLLVIAGYLVPSIDSDESIFWSFYRSLNFFVFMALALFFTRNLKFKKLNILIFLTAGIFLLQYLQELSSNEREFDFHAISLAFLGSFVGLYLAKSLNFLLHKLLGLLSSFRQVELENVYLKYLKKVKDFNKPLSEEKFFTILFRKFLLLLNSIASEEDSVISEIEIEGGESFFSNSNNLYSFEIALHGFYEADTSLIFKEQVKEGDTVLDIGAHYGIHSIHLSNLVGKSGKVLSFEPSESALNILKINCDQRNNIDLFEMALFSSNTILSFNNYGTGFSEFNSIYGPRTEEKIASKTNLLKVDTLDNLHEKSEFSPSFVKLDCESSELEVLKGMSRIIKKYKPKCLVGFEDLPNIDLPKNKEIYNFFIERGYQPYIRLFEGYKEIEPLEWFPKTNILFVHKENVHKFIKN